LFLGVGVEEHLLVAEGTAETLGGVFYVEFLGLSSVPVLLLGEL
jgi:hypothetical protein